jgi:hypothetical protein
MQWAWVSMGTGAGGTFVCDSGAAEGALSYFERRCMDHAASIDLE